MTEPRASVRLALPEIRGAALYNSYHYLMQLSGLYHHATTLDHHENGPPVWNELAERALADIGELFSLWDETMRSAKDPNEPVVGDDVELARVVIRAAHRAAILINQLSTWTPILRWASVLRRCEHRWVRILDRLIVLAPNLSPRFQKLRLESVDRHQRLLGLLEAYTQEKARMAQGFEARKIANGDIVIE